MSQFVSSINIASVTRSVCELMDIPAPKGAAPANPALVESGRLTFSGAPLDRVFLYNPDAIALWLFLKYTERFTPALAASQLQLPLGSVMPCVTPVCFASMYTGVTPADHGIQAYEKPVLRCDTLFDALLRAGKKPVIVATAGDSMSKIFLEREMDYYFYPTPAECTAKAMELLAEDKHDLIALYNGNFDATMHRTGPEAPEALAELDVNVETFAALSAALRKHWSGHRTLLGFCPDHGCHEIDGKLGSHGLDMPEDMNVVHLYSFL